MNFTGSEEDYKRMISKKGTEGFQKKYGIDNPSHSEAVKEKRINTFLKKYGKENPFAAEEVKEKIKEHYKNLYSVDNPMMVPEIKNKVSSAVQKTKLIKYHSEAVVNILLDREAFKNEILSLPIDERSYTGIGKHFGIDDTTIRDYIYKYKLLDIVKPKMSSSSFEKEIYEYILSLGISGNDILRNDKNTLKQYELDIYIKSKKIAIEFNGNYWHNEEHLSQKYHQQKSLAAKNIGVFIYHIFEYEWNDAIKQQKIKAHLKNILCSENNIRVYARDCELCQVPKEDKNIFLDSYHLQGADRSLYSFGLKFNDELVLVMTFCKARFSNATWELSRLCIKSGYSIIGGASKVLKYFIKTICIAGETIVTYNDIGKSKGAVYPKIGFKFSNISKPSYVWWHSHQPVISRYKVQIKNEIKIMHEKKYTRIFDAGNNVWILNI